MSNAPCFGCGDRNPGCHDICERYKIYQESRKVHNYNVFKKRNEEKEVEDFQLHKFHKNKRK